MIEDIFLPLISIIVGFLYSKWLYKSNGNSFFNKKDNSFGKVQTLKGWFGGLVLVIVGILFLLKGILSIINSVRL
jgi:hypothetical protein